MWTLRPVADLRDALRPSEFLPDPRLEVWIAWPVGRSPEPPAPDHRVVQDLADRRPHRPQVGPRARHPPGEATEGTAEEVVDPPRPLVPRRRDRRRLDLEAGLDRSLHDPFARQDGERVPGFGGHRPAAA